MTNVMWKYAVLEKMSGLLHERWSVLGPFLRELDKVKETFHCDGESPLRVVRGHLLGRKEVAGDFLHCISSPNWARCLQRFF